MALFKKWVSPTTSSEDYAMEASPLSSRGSIQLKFNPIKNYSLLDFFSLFSAFFSFADLSGAFLTFFFESLPFAMIIMC